jgi:transglutaminase-like putative cysteine protease
MRIVFIFCFLVSLGASAADPKYPVMLIPAALKENANVIIRNEEMTFKIISKSKAVFTVKSAYTILNEKGSRYASAVVPYDKLSKINRFEAGAYDAAGKQIKKLKHSEFYDQSAFDGFSLYSDNRIKVADVTQNTYPYTVEFEYEIEYKFLFFIPSYVLLYSEKVAVEKSSYSLLFPKELQPRYQTQNVAVEANRSKTPDGLESIVWSFSNVLPISFETHGPLREALVTRISAAPSTFSYEGYEGNMNSWTEFGTWISSLNKGRDILPAETEQKIKQLTASLKTTEEKVKAVYQYMQNKTRYVSIQLGIGGHQPFEAAVVDNTGYGDCKALSNYTIAMLAAAGVKANYVLIRAGEDEAQMQTDFPSSQFNHAIAAVPNGADTLWLECTSQVNPFGWTGSFTGDRHALMITEQGGKVVKTPAYPAEVNTQKRTALVSLDLAGNATARVNTVYAGLQYENNGLDAVANRQADDHKKWIQNNTQIPSFDIRKFSIENIKEKIPSAKVEVEYTLNRLATVNGKRMFLTPNLMNRHSYIPEKVEQRKSDVVLRTPYIDEDVIEYSIPEAIYPEFVPEAVKLKSRFGEYESSYKVDQGKLIYTRKVRMNKGQFPAASYQEFQEFYKSMNKADNAKVVFVTKT